MSDRSNISTSVPEPNETCRICMSTTKLNNSIFSNSDAYNVSYAQTIVACTSVQILVDDGLPSLICDICLESLEKFLNLCQQCVKSDKILRYAKNSHQELKNDEILIKTEDNDSDCQEYSGQADKVIDDSFSSFAFAGVEDNSEKDLMEWYSQQSIDIKEENIVLERKSENKICSGKMCVTKKGGDSIEKISIFKQETPNKVYSNETNKDVRKDSKVCQFQCEICGKCFVRKHDLTNHVQVHTNEYPFKCPLCPKSFAHKIALKDHSFAHSGERPFRCDKCGKAFTQKSSLFIHLGIHIGE